MIIQKAEYMKTAVLPSQYPPPDRPEIAFVGRSNVGKSSLINSLLNRKSLARVSSEPGKTRTINFYNVNDMLYFVDLPGYGFAKVSKEEKKRWGNIIEGYLNKRETLVSVVLIVDIRHEPTGDDLIMYNWIKSYVSSVTVVASKCDKIAKGQYQKHLSVIRKFLNMDSRDTLVTYSAESKYGRDELWAAFDIMLGIQEA